METIDDEIDVHVPIDLDATDIGKIHEGINF